jgi:hypothetical protein
MKIETSFQKNSITRLLQFAIDQGAKLSLNERDESHKIDFRSNQKQDCTGLLSMDDYLNLIEMK